jgi:hypothetical protein
MELQKRHFKFKKNRCPRHVKWLERDVVYEGELLSMTARTVRLYSPESTEPRRQADVSYDWLIPVP